MRTYGNVPLNEFMQPKGAPVTSARQRYNAVTSEGRDDWQGKAIRLSNINLENAVEISSGASASGAFSGGSIMFITSRLTPNIPYQDSANLAVPFTSIYLGTVSGVGTAQIYPYPASAAIAARYKTEMMMDYHHTQEGTTGIAAFRWSVLRGYILDTAGTSNDSIIITTKWKALKFNISHKNT